MTNQDNVWRILDDVLVLLAGQHYPTPERTYKLDGGWSLALADLKACFADLRAKLAAAEADRDAAQAGEARAVETLRRCHEGAARQLAEPRDHDDDQYALTAIATDCEAALADSANALDWLTQQRREAVAAWIEKEATKCRQQDGEYYERGVDCMLREAAALGGGEVGDAK